MFELDLTSYFWPEVNASFIISLLVIQTNKQQQKPLDKTEKTLTKHDYILESVRSYFLNPMSWGLYSLKPGGFFGLIMCIQTMKNTRSLILY